MPRSALDFVGVDHVLPLKEIPLVDPIEPPAAVKASPLD
jgi:hypothetical protein